MDKLSVRDVDAHMAGRLVVARVAEEDQVAGLKLVAGDGNAVLHLIAGGAVDAVSKVAVHILGKARAVEAVGAVSAVDIGGAQKGLSVLHDLETCGGGDPVAPDAGGVLPPGLGGLILGGGRAVRLLGADGDVVAGDVALGVLILNLEPAGIHAHQLDHRAVGNLLGAVVAGARAGAHIQHTAVGLHLAVA